MNKVYLHTDNIFSPLGETTAANMNALRLGISGIRREKKLLGDEPVCASLFPAGLQPLSDNEKHHDLSFFESITLASASDALKNSGLDARDSRTGFILSTTKGNISLVEAENRQEIPESLLSLNDSADRIARALGMQGESLVVSHACISGLLAMITGMRLIQAGRYDHLVITGADLITPFIFSGFRSFQAISPNPCRPFDAARDGISLGEAAATVILSAEKSSDSIQLKGGSVTNDANHISGPSRTGHELALAILRALKQSNVEPEEIDFISAHGTATRYNDEMEAKAFHLAGLQEKPVNSLKGYYGHTLGAAGLLESIITAHSMKESILIPTLGFTEPGTELPVNIVKSFTSATLKRTLKTASGFGGCNAAIILENPN